MSKRFSRTELLFGREAMEKLSRAHVAVFGVGGVGGYAVEALARSGVGTFTLVDSDDVHISNLNRQIIATVDTLGRPKTEVMKERILSINPEASVFTDETFVLPENISRFDFTRFDYIVDAIDTVTAKIALICAAKEARTPIISSMGTGNKVDPSRLEVADISRTSVCPLARVIRYELRKRRISKLKVVYSKEEPIKALVPPEDSGGRHAPGSTAFVPPTAGLLIASEVVKDLIGYKENGL